MVNLEELKNARVIQAKHQHTHTTRRERVLLLSLIYLLSLPCNSLVQPKRSLINMTPYSDDHVASDDVSTRRIHKVHLQRRV